MAVFLTLKLKLIVYHVHAEVKFTYVEYSEGPLMCKIVLLCDINACNLCNAQSDL